MSSGRKVFITGASKGIGKELALRYGRDSSVFLFARNETALSEICNYLTREGCNAGYYAGDVGSREDVHLAIQAANKFMGGINLAFLNAGVSEHINLRNLDSRKFEAAHRTNLLGNVYCLESLIPIMKDKGGIIAGISSIADFRGTPGSSAYSSSKISFTYLLEAARIELKGLGIKVITVRFGFVKTDIIKKNNFYMPLIMSAEECVRRIAEGIEKEKSVIQFPWPMVWLTNIAKFAPKALYDKALSFRIGK